MQKKFAMRAVKAAWALGIKHRRGIAVHSERYNVQNPGN